MYMMRTDGSTPSEQEKVSCGETSGTADFATKFPAMNIELAIYMLRHNTELWSCGEVRVLTSDQLVGARQHGQRNSYEF